MKLINIQIYLLIIITLIFSNCRERTVQVDLPVSENEIIINAIISPNDSLLNVRISKSQPAFGKKSNDPFQLLILSRQIDSVIIKNTENNQKIVLPLVKESAEPPEDFDGFSLHSSSLIYTAFTSNFPIQEGKTYQLVVSMKDNIKITAQTTIPSIIDTTRINAINNSIQWRDVKNTTNFYSVEARVKIISTDNFGEQAFFFIELPFSNELFTDENKDGKILSAKLDIDVSLETYISEFNSGNSNQALGGNEKLEIEVLSIPEIFYDYLKAIETYERYNDGSNNNPINIPTNIEGDALGIFSSYNTTKKIMDLPSN